MAGNCMSTTATARCCSSCTRDRDSSTGALQPTSRSGILTNITVLSNGTVGSAQAGRMGSPCVATSLIMSKLQASSLPYMPCRLHMHMRMHQLPVNTCTGCPLAACLHNISITTLVIGIPCLERPNMLAMSPLQDDGNFVVYGNTCNMMAQTGAQTTPVQPPCLTHARGGPDYWFLPSSWRTRTGNLLCRSIACSTAA